MADLTDPKDYSHATRGRRELDDYKAAYNSEKQSEAINANTDELESLAQTTNSKLASIDSRLQTISGYVDTLESKLDSVLGRLDNIIDLMTPTEPEV